MKVAACADLHLDRTPAFLRDTGNGSGHWVLDRLVDALAGKGYDALLLCGDIMDSENSWFSCYGPLIRGLERLRAAGIKVFAVAGNHDSNIFPRMAATQQDKVVVLGLGGQWSWRDWGPARFVGWSFPQPQMRTSPMLAYDRGADDFQGPIIGLLHCDLRRSPSPTPYAGVLEREIENARPDYWFLGHIHKKSSSGKAFYCGSPYPLDRSEEGFHGFWSLNVTDGGASKPVFVQLNDNIYTTTRVDLSAVEDLETFEAVLLDSLGARMADLSRNSQIPLSRVFHHLVFEGVLRRKLEIESLVRRNGDSIMDFSARIGGSDALISGWEDQTQFELPLVELAKRPGPVGALAGLIQSPPEKAILEMRKALLAMRGGAGFGQLDDPPCDAEEFLRMAGKRLLGKILAEEGKA